MLTVEQLCKMSGLGRNAVYTRFKRAGIKAAERSGLFRLYDDSALEALKPRTLLSDEEKKRRKRECDRKHRAEHPEIYRAANRRYYEKRRADSARRNAEFQSAKVGFYFVSVQDFSGRWAIKAVCLPYLDARMVSEELNALGIKAHFRSHKWSAKKKA